MKENKPNIKLIVDGCLSGNTLSENKLFQMYYGFAKAICVRYSNSKEESQEMLNDTFYTVFKNISKYDTQYPFEPWLRKLCVNVCLKYKRKYTSEWSKSQFVEVTDDNLLSKEMVLPDTDQLNYLKLLDQLPDACKTVINLFIIEEYKHHEIAEALNISVGTSKSNLHRAKALLFKMLEKDSKGRLKIRSSYEG